jgi:hypothetical protein
MRGIIIGFFLLLRVVVMQAQIRTDSPVGEYYLRGVMETASGFRLNSDSTFQFFFSYGALDREGQGTWKQEGSSIVFNSTKTNGQDYALAKSGKRTGNGITIVISGANAQFKRLVQARVVENGREEQAEADENGVMHFRSSHADTVELFFELCPEKSSLFKIENNTHNYFEFRFEPGIMDVSFNNFRLNVHPEQLTGPHPLMTNKTFTYTKAKQ